MQECFNSIGSTDMIKIGLILLLVKTDITLQNTVQRFVEFVEGTVYFCLSAMVTPHP